MSNSNNSDKNLINRLCDSLYIADKKENSEIQRRVDDVSPLLDALQPVIQNIEGLQRFVDDADDSVSIAAVEMKKLMAQLQQRKKNAVQHHSGTRCVRDSNGYQSIESQGQESRRQKKEGSQR